ncbi:M10 family metallopeptidase [Pseudoroseomonas cervicalis]|uniref:M10 family metallopeptidase n=1 Tax=Teichococcus cervicalis TaxID=204525 RepID=UPI002784E5F9|nr:M10 family metallopeptidase [Pseudoroseomonas cervicalis]MDQ1077811.1 serralysin [Pseudoroseomonas cervicalis]
MTAYNPLTGITWNVSLSDLNVTYRFMEAGSSVTIPPDEDDVDENGNPEQPLTVVSQEWNEYERGQVLKAFELFERITNLTFTEAAPGEDADFRMVLGDFQRDTVAGLMVPPLGGELDGYGLFNVTAPVWNRSPGGPLDIGGDSFQTLIHEMGHGLGLAHPHGADGGSTIFPGVTDEEDVGEFGLNQTVWTMMSYVEGWATGPDGLAGSKDYGRNFTPMAFDIAVLQAKYGVNTTYANGDDVYELWDADATGTGYAAIWDTGGSDTIRYSGLRDTVIDLRAATLEWAPGGGGYMSYAAGVHGGYTIAHGVVIERAILGGGNDRAMGNDADNYFFGGAGNDMIDGGGGRNTAGFDSDFADVASAGRYGNTATIDGPEGYDILTNIQRLVFADGVIELDRGSPLVDTLSYYSDNRDVWLAGMAAEEHFAQYGWREGRDPNAFFSVSGYLAVNRDVADAGINPLDHYLNFGWREGRDASAWFDTEAYLKANADVAAAGINPLLHYLAFGQAENRFNHLVLGEEIRGGVDAEYYRISNPDVTRAGLDAQQHYDLFGWREGRDPNGWFDTDFYLEWNQDVAAAGINPLEHYHQFGWREGRNPSEIFDTEGYLAANADVAAAGIDPLEHYLRFGAAEGREAVF